MKKNKVKSKKEKLLDNKKKILKDKKKALRRKIIAIVIVTGLLLSVAFFLIKAVSASTIAPTSTVTITVENSELNATTNYILNISDTQKNIKYFEYSHNYPIFADYVPVISGFSITKISNSSIKVIPAIAGKSYSLTLTNIKNPAFEMPETSCTYRIGGLFYIIYGDNSQDSLLTNLVRTTAPLLKITEDSVVDSCAEKPLQLNFTLDSGMDTRLSEIAIRLTGVNSLIFSKSSFCTINGITVNSFFHAADYFYIEVPSYLKSPFRVILDKSMNISLLPGKTTLNVEYSCTPENSGFSINQGSPVKRTYTLPHYLALTVPIINFPKNNSILEYSKNAVLIKWDVVLNASEYSVSLNKKDKSSGIVTQTYLSTSNNYLSLFLQEYTQYTIAVNAKNIINAVTNYSNPVTFFMVPENISLISPENNSFIPLSQNTISFSVANAKFKASYQLEIGQTRDFPNSTNKIFKGIFEETSSTINIPTSSFKVGYTYYWKVEEILVPRYEMPWTETRSFTFGSFLIPTFNDKSLNGSIVRKQNPFNLNYTNPDPSKTIVLSFSNKTKNKFLIKFDLLRKTSVNVFSTTLPKALFNYFDTFIVRIEFKDKTFSTGFDEMKFVLNPDTNTLIIKSSTIKAKYNKLTKNVLLTWPVVPAQIRTYKIHLYIKDSKGNFIEKKIIDTTLNYVSFGLVQYNVGTRIYFKIQAIPIASPPVILDNLPYFEFVIPKA